MDFITECINDIKEMHDKTIWKCFSKCGFTKQFIIDHISDFSVMSCDHGLDLFYYKGRLLFSIKQIYDMVNNVVRFDVDFGKGWRKK